MYNDRIVAAVLDLGKRIKQDMSKALPIPYMQGEALRVIEQRGEKNGIRMHDLAKYFNITAPSATTLVDELVTAQYVTRVANARDRRQVLLQLTPKGSRLVASHATVRAKAIAHVFSKLTDAERSNLASLLEKVTRA